MGLSVNASKYPRFPNYDRERYLKISLSESEMKVYELELKKLSSFFKENGVLLNQPELFRTILSNLDNSELQKILLSLYQSEIHPMFKITA